MKARVYCDVEGMELPPNSQSSATEVQDGSSHDWITWKCFDHLHGKLIVDSQNQKIPLWAVPNVHAAWISRRNKFRRCWYCIYSHLISLINVDLCHS